MFSRAGHQSPIGGPPCSHHKDSNGPPGSSSFCEKPAVTVTTCQGHQEPGCSHSLSTCGNLQLHLHIQLCLCDLRRCNCNCGEKIELAAKPSGPEKKPTALPGVVDNEPKEQPPASPDDEEFVSYTEIQDANSGQMVACSLGPLM